MTFKKLTADGSAVIPLGLGIGLLVSILFTVAGAAICAWLISSERIGEESIGLLAAVIVILAAAVGAFSASLTVKKMRLQICLLSGVCYFLVLLATTALFFGGQFKGIGIGLIAVSAGCVPIAFLPIKNGRAGKRKRRAYR